MKRIGLLLVFTFAALLLHAQSAGDFFNKAANQYIYENDQLALNTIGAGLNAYPDDVPLTKLKEKIEKEQQENQQQQQQQQDQQQQQEEEQQQDEQQQEEQENQEQDQEQQQQQDQEQSEDSADAEEKEQSEQAQQQETEEDGEEMEQPPQSRSEKLEELNLTEEKARMILEAMKNNEIQYIQQNRRKPTKKPDSNKPDW